jgi:predicted enzyme related to lactoylglutathione lyase
MSSDPQPGGFASARVSTITVDCADAGRVARFWSALLGAPVDTADPSVVPAALPGGVGMYFQEVPEPKRVKNRLHLDLAVSAIDEASERAVALGGRVVGDVESWRVMADPEGNEFCLVLD